MLVNENNLLIKLEDIHFSYAGGPPILNGINFEFHEGERVGLIGPNGSGKTTLFHAIIGLLKPNRGTIEIFGKKMEEEKHFVQIRQEIGLLFQDSDDQLFSPTVLEDVAFGPLNQGKTMDEAIDISRDTLGMLGLSGLEDKVTHKLSGGEKRLVSLATVLSMQPRVLLLDEPTTGLDPVSSERMIDIVNRLDISSIFISHDMDFIVQTTQRIYGMEKGRIFLEDEAIPHTHVHSHGFGRFPHSHSYGDKLRTVSETKNS
jgi:cobalt/nickel transport system ATP-binding protein